MASTNALDDSQKALPRQKNSRVWMKSSWTKMWSRSKLDKATALQMLKGGLPPVIVVSMYQSSSVANIEFTVGYLATILAVSAQCLMPRAKFMKIMFFSVLSTCLGAALSCLVVFCSVRARQHTTPANASQSVKHGYNSSASAVSAIWLLFSIWLANALRALRPIELQDPMVALSIFSVVAMTHTPSFTNISEGLIFVRRLLETFLLGQAVATGVSLFVLPITSRKNAFKALNLFTSALDRCFEAQISFVREKRTRADFEAGGKVNQYTERFLRNGVNEKPIASTLAALRDQVSMLSGALPYIRLEIAWGKLLPRDFDCIYNHLRLLFLPLAGLSMFPEIFREILEHRSATSTSNTADRVSDQTYEVAWEGLMNGLEERLASTRRLATTGVSLAFRMLEIDIPLSAEFQRHHNSPDVEKQGSGLAAEPNKLSEDFRKDCVIYTERRLNLHKTWPSLMFPSAGKEPATMSTGDIPLGVEVKDHLLVFLFMEHLQNQTLQAVRGLVAFAETKVSSGSMRRKKIILPGYDHLKAIVTPHKSADSETSTSWYGRPLVSPDAEHLAPANFFERSSNYLRIIPSILKSPESVFGFRVALASFTVAILAYLRQTQDFFNAQRLIWAMIVIVIGMKPESGASIFGYVARVAGTVVAMILSLIAWYIVDGHVAGVLVFLYIANVFGYYFWVRFPQFLGPCTISVVTLNVIVAYELQVKKLGVETATSNGQPYYPIYLFGPYKLLCVLAGITISFVWTIFPCQVSARSRVRRTLGHCLFLLAKSYSCMHASVKIWINEQQGDMNDPSSPGSQLQSSSRKMFSGQMALLAQTQSLIHWTTYEPPIGGKFPRAVYKSAVSEMQMLATCIALMSHATRDLDLFYPKSEPEDSELRPTSVEEEWIHQLARATTSPEFDSHEAASLLCHLAAAISNDSPLPPYLSLPEHFPLARKVREINAQAMDVENIQDMAFSAFACMEVTTSLVSSRLKSLVKNVKSLVGEINFDDHLRDG